MLEALAQGVRGTVSVVAHKGECQSRKTEHSFSTGRDWPCMLHFSSALQLVLITAEIQTEFVSYRCTGKL